MARTVPIKGMTYWLRSKLYVALTNENVSIPSIILRGPSFQMPESAQFQLLEKDREPTAKEIFEAVDDAFDKELVIQNSMESDDVSFAGYGDPLLRLDVLTEAAKMIKEKRHGASLRVRTNGLISSKSSPEVAALLKSSGIDKMSISLLADSPGAFQKVLAPTNNLGFQDVCAFIIACNEAGLEVTCTAVESPTINISSVRSLAFALGASDFSSYTFHP